MWHVSQTILLYLVSSNLSHSLTVTGIYFSSVIDKATDLILCFAQVLNRMQEKEYANADAIVLFDFIAQRLPVEMLEQVRDLKEKGEPLQCGLSVASR